MLTFIILFIHVSSAIATEHVYFLIDKSNSMWAHDPNDPDKKTLLDFAKDRVYEAIQSNKPKDSWRNIYIYIFDSEWKAFSKEIFSVQEARNLLEPEQPGGWTTIGDRLDDVRRRIQKSGVKSVEIHLLSDMEETRVGSVTKEEAIQRLNNLLQSKVSRIGVKLIAYTWKTGLQQGDIDSPNVEYRPLKKTAIRASISSVDEIVMALVEKQGQFAGAKPAQTTLIGYFAPAFHHTHTSLTVTAKIQEMPDVKLLINGQFESDIGQYAATNGNIKITLNVQIQNPDIFDRYISSAGFVNRSYQAIFTPKLNSIPDSLERQYTIDAPNARICPVTFTSQPYIYIKNYPKGKSIYRSKITEGSSMKELIELAWNLGAVGETLEWTTPKFGNMFGYMTLPNGQELRHFQLDHRLSRTVVFNMDQVHELRDGGFLTFSIRGKNISRKVPVKIEAKPLKLYIKNNISSESFFENSQRTVTPGVIIEPNSFNMPHPIDLSLQLSECRGTACDGLSINLFEQTNPNLRIKKESPQVLRIDSPLWFDASVQTKSSGDAQFNLIAKSSKQVLSYNKKPYKSKSYPIKLTVNPKEVITVSFQPLQNLSFFVVEKDGRFTSIKEQSLSINGSISPEVMNQNKKLFLHANIEEYPNISVHLNKQSKLDCTQYIINNELNISRLMVSIIGHEFLDLIRNNTSKFTGNPFHLVLKPEIEPKPSMKELSQYEYQIKDKDVKTSFTLHCKPSINVSPQQMKDKCFVDQDIVFPFKMKWNLCMVGKTIYWRLPDANMYDKGCVTYESTNKCINDYRLDRSFETHFNLKFYGIKESFTNQFLSIQVKKNKNAFEYNIPIDIIADRPHIIIKTETDINQILQTDPIEIHNALALKSNFNHKQYPVRISIYGCEGRLCDDLQFSLDDEVTNESMVSLAKRSRQMNIKNDRRLKYKLQTKRAGKALIGIEFSSNDNIFYDKQKYKNQVKKDIALNIVIPRLEWKATLKRKNVRLGTSANPIPFRTYGKPQSTNDDAIEVSAKFNAELFQGDAINLKIQVISEENPPLVKTVYFNATKKDTCTVEQFINNPHFSFSVDTDQKKFLRANTGKGRFIIMFMPEKYNVNNTINIYYKIKLEY